MRNVEQVCFDHFSGPKSYHVFGMQCNQLEINITLLSNIKVEYHANENLLTNSEKIAYFGQRLMYPIKNNNLTMPFCF